MILTGRPNVSRSVKTLLPSANTFLPVNSAILHEIQILSVKGKPLKLKLSLPPTGIAGALMRTILGDAKIISPSFNRHAHFIAIEIIGLLCFQIA